MNAEQLSQKIIEKESFLCIGLDTDINKIPACLLSYEDPVFEFNKQIIDATHFYAVAYKPNVAFYEVNGETGWKTLKKTVTYIREKDPGIFIIADAKRGDIGNTSRLYARAFFETLEVDALTIAPYMGRDSILPFLEYKEKWVILLALTSNAGASDFQFFYNEKEHIALYQKVLQTAKTWGSPDQMMFVTGATRADKLAEVRKIVPDHFLLIPGVGTQGGNLEKVAKYGMNSRCGILVNSSRGIIYAANDESFAEKAAGKAFGLQQQMHNLLLKKEIIQP